MTYYFVDAENVGCDIIKLLLTKVEKDSMILIFYTDYCPIKKIVTVVRNTWKYDMHNVIYHHVLKGKQNLDRQLLSCMGFIMGKAPNRDDEYCIVSYDKGYMASCIFWRDEGWNCKYIIPLNEQTINKIDTIMKKHLSKKRYKIYTENRQIIIDALLNYRYCDHDKQKLHTRLISELKDKGIYIYRALKQAKLL